MSSLSLEFICFRAEMPLLHPSSASVDAFCSAFLMLPRSPGFLFNSNFYFVLPPLHGYSHEARFFSECQTSILRNFENRFLPFSVASTLSLVSALCCCPHACRPPGNFRFEFQCSRLVIMRVRFSRRLSPLAVFFTIFARSVTPCTFHLSSILFAFTFRKAFPKVF